MLTEVEVANAIEEMGVSDFVGRLDNWGDSTKAADLSVGEAVLKDAKFGCEGGGEELWLVFAIGEQFFRITGYYSSYEGSEWESDVTEVEPREKVVTVYEPKKK